MFCWPVCTFTSEPPPPPHPGDEDLGGSALASETDLVFAENHENQLEQIRKLRKEVDSLREFVSEQLALQVSSACHIQ